MEIFWEVFIILDAIKNICGSWEEVKISTLTGIWKQLIPSLMDDIEWFKTSVQKVTADMVETARELESGVEPDNGTEWLPAHETTLMDEEWPLMDE